MVFISLQHIIPALKREGFPTVPEITWQDIGGLEDIKKELREKILVSFIYLFIFFFLP